MKLPIHDNCPNARTYLRRHVSTVAIYQRDPKTRTMQRIGIRCLKCNTVKLDNWPAWAIVT